MSHLNSYVFQEGMEPVVVPAEFWERLPNLRSRFKRMRKAGYLLPYEVALLRQCSPNIPNVSGKLYLALKEAEIAEHVRLHEETGAEMPTIGGVAVWELFFD